jgi:aminoglycoside 3-N-acetyltransferase
MSLGSILLKILPENYFLKARKLYHRILHLRYPKLSEEKFRSILTDMLGVGKGDVVFIHSSFENLNPGFSAFSIIDILLDIVGAEGTLVFPCWHFDYRAEEYLKNDELFDVQKSPTVMGFLPGLACRYENSRRSLHPTNSCIAIGKYAEEITRDHHKTIYPCDENSPFYRIINYHGKIIGLGVSTYNLSFVHCAEDIMKTDFPVKTRTDQVFEGVVRDYGGNIIHVKTKAAHVQVKHNNIQRFVKKYIPRQICYDFKINGTKFFKANAAKLLDKMMELAKQDVTIYTSKAVERNKR